MKANLLSLRNLPRYVYFQTRLYESSALCLHINQRNTKGEVGGWRVHKAGMPRSAGEEQRKFVSCSCAWCFHWGLESDASVIAMPLGPLVPDLCALGAPFQAKNTEIVLMSVQWPI